jgi:outer membrane receptor protein involved in Fe transport
MKHSLIIFLLSVSYILSYSQQVKTVKPYKIIGVVNDISSNQPIEYATITVFLNGSTKPVNGIATDSNGSFAVDNLEAGNYYANINFIGYKKKTINNISIGANQFVVDLGNIILENNTKVLEGVTVTANKPLVENKIDKIIVNVERDVTSQGGVATDILKKVPQVSVDVNGNVELQGNSNILFLVNGKPSTIFGSNITDVLQSIPASQIQSIEVITNPGAKYDAQGTGGIINIILKHNTVQGINGNVSLTSGTIFQNGSVNINARKGNFGMNVFLNGNARLTTTTPTSFNRTGTDSATNTHSILNQDGSSNFNRHGIQSGIGFDWTVDEMNSISGAMSFNNFGNMSKGLVNQTEQTQATLGGTYSTTNSINNTNSSFAEYSFDPSLNYKHSFNNKDQQLEIEASGSFSKNKILSGNDQFIKPQDSLVYGTRNNNPAKENEYEVKADYTQPLAKDINLGLGGKFSGYEISSTANAMLWNSNFDSYLFNTALSNDLNYNQKVYAAYAELNFPFGKWFDARLGGRYERTQVKAFYSNAQQKIQNGYNTFIPSIFLMKKVKENQTIKLSLTLRINRPDYGELNPYINASDPKNISTGNPNLKPEIWDRYEASYNNDLGKLGAFMITLYYRQSNGDIQPFITYYSAIKVGDTTYNNVAFTTRENIGIEKNAGTNLFFQFHVNEKLNVRSNINYFYRYTINQVNHGYNSSTTIFRFNANASYQITDNFAAEFFGSFNSRHHEAQGYYPSFTSYSLALREQFWNKKGSLALIANNFLSNYMDQRTNLYGPGFETSSVRKIPYRSIGINFTLKFGKLELKKEKSEENNIDLSAPQQ